VLRKAAVILAAKKKGYALAAVSGLWLGVILFVVSENVILRETWLGGIAKAMDALPPAIGSICFLASWVIFFFGWIAPAFFAARQLRPSRKPNGQELRTTNDERPTTPL
jgi:hypothetical protein